MYTPLKVHYFHPLWKAVVFKQKKKERKESLFWMSVFAIVICSVLFCCVAAVDVDVEVHHLFLFPISPFFSPMDPSKGCVGNVGEGVGCSDSGSIIAE